MLPALSIAAMSFSALVFILLPAVLAPVFLKKWASANALLVWVGVFLIFQVLTRIPLLAYLSPFDAYQEPSRNVALAAFFLSFTAGLFEASGRCLGFCHLLRDKPTRANGIAYGIGHRGIEALVLVGMT